MLTLAVLSLAWSMAMYNNIYIFCFISSFKIYTPTKLCHVLLHYTIVLYSPAVYYQTE